MSTSASTRRNPSLSGSSRLSLSVGKTSSVAPGKQERHPLKHDWSISYIHRPPGAKIDYASEIKRFATFGSIQSFLHLYSHIAPVNEMTPTTDVLVFLSRIAVPGVWEELPEGGKFTIRLVRDIAPLLFENLLFGLIGDQFEDSDGVVGGAISVRHSEAILTVWVEEEGEAVKSGQLKEKIISLLGLPAGTMCEYRSSKALMEAASKPQTESGGHDARGFNQHNSHQHGNHHNTNYNQRGGGGGADRENQSQHFQRDGQQHGHYRHDRNNHQRGGGAGFRRGGGAGAGGEEDSGEQQQQQQHHRAPRERPEGREARSTAWGR